MAQFIFKPMDLKKFSPEVYKSIHFLKANCIRILKSVDLICLLATVRTLKSNIQGGTIILQ